MTLRRLKWLTILAPLLFLGGVELLPTSHLSRTSFRAWPGDLLLAGMVLLGTLFFAEAVFDVVERLQERLAQRNQELLALHDAGLGIHRRAQPGDPSSKRLSIAPATWSAPATARCRCSGRRVASRPS